MSIKKTPDQYVVMTPGKLRYAEKVAIRLAVEILTRMPHERERTEVSFYMNSPYSTAARHLGAIGWGRDELLEDLVGILIMHGVKPIGTIRRALDAAPASGQEVA